ncbi:MAG: zinc metallopeptidase [Chloroflexi bacterium]|nr:zinc metallopeptidase [Chloroflexota bacterium]
MFFDPTYILMVFLPTLLITGLAQLWVSSAYRKWSHIQNSRRITGYDTAQALMRGGLIQQVGVEVGGSELSDHYDPTKGIVRLSPGVASQPSIASMAIAAHEFGHVQQHQQHSPLMAMRSALVPGAKLGSGLGFTLIFLGMILNFMGLALIGLILFAATTVFTFVTLPVELDASRRALILLRESGLLADKQDEQGARAVLTAAAFTYVAAVATSLLTLLYYAMIVFGGRSRD